MPQLPDNRSITRKSGSGTGIGGNSGAVAHGNLRAVRGPEGKAAIALKTPAPTKDYSADIYSTVVDQIAKVQSAVGNYQTIKKQEQLDDDKYNYDTTINDYNVAVAELNFSFNDDKEYETIEERYGTALNKLSDKFGRRINNDKLRKAFTSESTLTMYKGLGVMRNVANKAKADTAVADLNNHLSLAIPALVEQDGVVTAIDSAQERIDIALEHGYISEVQAEKTARETTSNIIMTKLNLLDGRPVEQAKLIEMYKKFVDPDLLEDMRKQNAIDGMTSQANGQQDAWIRDGATMDTMLDTVANTKDPDLRALLMAKAIQANSLIATVKAQDYNSAIIEAVDLLNPQRETTEADAMEPHEVTVLRPAKYASPAELPLHLQKRLGAEGMSKLLKPTIKEDNIEHWKAISRLIDNGDYEGAGNALNTATLTNGSIKTLFTRMEKARKGIKDEGLYTFEQQMLNSLTGLANDTKNQIKSHMDKLVIKYKAANNDQLPDSKWLYENLDPLLLDANNKLWNGSKDAAPSYDQVMENRVESVFGVEVDERIEKKYYSGDKEDAARAALIQWWERNPNATILDVGRELDRLLGVEKSSATFGSSKSNDPNAFSFDAFEWNN